MALGTEIRYDHIGNVGVNRTVDRTFLTSLGRCQVREFSGALYVEATWKPVADLHLTGGVRGDHYSYDVQAQGAVAASPGEGSGADAILSPKVSIAYRMAPQLDPCQLGPRFSLQ